ncbi:MAG: hypothetical protein IJM79_02295 [Erysipelotrichaceae bacterium]|nr:hypothetical protein [Erysipelotrichaceae bacterium]
MTDNKLKNKMSAEDFINSGIVKETKTESLKTDFDKLVRYFVRPVAKNGKLAKTEIDEEKELLTEYFQVHDVPLSELGLTVRSYNALSRSGYDCLSKLLDLSEDKILRIRNLGKKCIKEIYNAVQQIADPVIKQIKSGELTTDNIRELSDEEIRQLVLDFFLSNPEQQNTVTDVVDALGEKLSGEQISDALRKLVEEGKIVVENNMYSLRYPAFLEVVSQLESSKGAYILFQRIENGRTLDDIGKEFNVTRERIRQIQDKEIKRADWLLREKYGVQSYFEDRNARLFSLFEIEQDDWINVMGISPETYNYLDIKYRHKSDKDKDKKNKRNILDDSVDVFAYNPYERGLMQKYLRRNKVQIDGIWVYKSIASIEDFLIEKYCDKKIRITDFTKLYNNAMERNHISDPDLLIDSEKERTREHRITELRTVLWSTGKQFRYYDINSRDYAELYDTLALSQYKNTEISTLKFMNDYPVLMREYDIQDEYELHNLIKKTVAADKYAGMNLSRQPIIRFGDFDRNKMIAMMMVEMSPVSQNDLIDAIYEVYGFDKRSIRNDMKIIANYLHNGVYSIDSKPLKTADRELLRRNLTEDFYYIDEVVKLYHELNPNGDERVLTGQNLKSLGWSVHSNYIFHNYPNAKAMFREKLQEADEFDIKPLKKRYGRVMDFYSTIYELQEQRRIIETEPEHFVSLDKLEQQGVGLAEIQQFCDAVYDFVGDQYFTIDSLKHDGFINPVEAEMKHPYFYGALLKGDNRFRYSSTTSGIIFRKTDKPISRKDMIIELAEDTGSINIWDFIKNVNDTYNITIDKYDVINAIANTNIILDYENGALSVCE